MHCPNINSPEWNSLVKEVGEVEAWRTFFKYGEVVPVTEVTLKPGVTELFDSTPKLANAVYEALGFKNIQNKESVYPILNKKEAINTLKNRVKELEKELLLTFEGKGKRSEFWINEDIRTWEKIIKTLEENDNINVTNVFKNQNLGKDLSDKKGVEVFELEADNVFKVGVLFEKTVGVINAGKKVNSPRIHPFTEFHWFKNEFAAVATKAKGVPLKRGEKLILSDIEKQNLYSDLAQIENSGLTIDISKHNNFYYNKGEGVHFIDLGAETVTANEKNNNFFLDNFFENTSSEEFRKFKETFKPINQITPQQKQQAQQLYSQYLDTIFPNSKDKSIFYHGLPFIENKDDFFRDVEDEGIDELSKEANIRLWNYFFKSRDRARDYGDEQYAVVLDLSVDFESPEVSYKALPTFLTNDSAIVIAQGGDEYVVKSKKQIRILGSKQDIEGFKKFVESAGVFRSIRAKTTEEIAEDIDRRLMISQKEIKYTSYIQSLFLDAVGEISPGKILNTSFESAFNKAKYKFVASLRNVNDFLNTVKSEQVYDLLKEKDESKLNALLENFNLQGVKNYSDVIKAQDQYSSIVNEFDKYKDFVKAELLKMGIREVNGKIQEVNSEDVTNEEEDKTEEYLLAQNEIGERFDKGINEVNPLHTASATVKSLVNNIQIPGKYELGIPLYANPADVFQDILSAGVDMKLSGYTEDFDKYKAFVTSLQSLVEARPYLAEFINKLENFRKNNQWSTINQVLTFASKAFANETLVLYKLNKVGKEVKGVKEVKVVAINRESVEEQVAKGWFAQQLNSDFFDRTANGDLFPNKAKVERLNKIIEEGRAGTPEVQKTKLKEFFDVLGIKFTDKQINYFGERLGDKIKKGKSLSIVFTPNGMLDNIYQGYSKNLKTPFLSNYGIQNERKNLNKLARLYYEANPGMINVPSGKDAAGKSKYSNINTNFVEIKKRQWALGETSYLLNSPFAQPNKEFWTKVKNEAITFSLDYFNGVREQEAGKDGKTRKNLTNNEQTRAMFMKHQENMRTGTYVLFTLSDKTTSMEVKMTKEFFVDNEMVAVGKGTDFKIQNNEIVYTDFLKDKIYNNFVEPEISRILAAQKYADKVNLENFDTSSKLFYILPILNSSPFLENFRKDLYSGNYTIEQLKQNHGSIISNVVLNEFKQSVEDDINNYVADGIFKVDKGVFSFPSFKSGKANDYLFRFKSTDLKGRDLARAMVMDMKLNYMNAQVKTLQFLRFDPMVAFKMPKGLTKKAFNEYTGGEKVKIALTTWDEFSKRAAALIAPGSQGNWSWVTSKGERYFSKDYKAVTADDLTIVVNKVKNDTTDAQEFTTVQEHIDFLASEGKIDLDVWESITNKIRKAGKGGYYTLSDLEVKVIFTPLKPVQVSDQNEGDTGLNRIDYVKSSRYPLLPQHEAGSERDKLRIWMEQNDINSVNFASGKKLGRPTVSVVLFDKNGNFVEPSKEDTEKATQILSRDGLRTQQEIPHQKDEIPFITQMNRTLFDGLLDSVFKMEGLGDVTGLELKNLKERVRTRLFKLKSEELDQELGNLKANHIGLYKLLRKTILEDTSGSYGENDLRAIQLDSLTKKIAFPIELNPKAKKLQGLINSMINKNVMLKMNGSSFIQVSGVGSKFTFGTLSESIKSDIIWTDTYASTFKDGKASLAYISKKDGEVKPAQIIVSQYIKDENGKLIDLKQFIKEENKVKILDTSKLDPKLLRLVASRIPNQSLPSTLPVEVVGFLPEYMEDTIIVPDGITGQMGSDFDIDKLYAYKSKSIAQKDSKGNIIGYKSIPYKLTKVEDIDSLDEDQLKELYKDIHWTVLTNPDAFEKITKSIDSPEVKVKIDKRSKLLEKYNISTDPSVVLPLDFNTSIKRHEDNRSGKDGVSVFANYISAQADFQDKPLTLGYMTEKEDGKGFEAVKLPIYIKVNGKVEEFVFIGQNGKSKSQAGNTYTVGENINIPFGESVDNAKNLNLREFNWDKKAMSSVGILNMLTTEDKVALPIEFSMDLTSQEVIYDLFRRINKKQDSFEGFESNAFVNSVQEIASEITGKIGGLDKFKDEESLVAYLSDSKRKKQDPLSVEKLENMWIVGKLLSSNNQAVFGALIQEDALAKGENIRDVQEEKLLTLSKDLGYKSVKDLLLDYYVTQYDSLELFSRLDEIGKEFMTILGSVYTYTKGIGADVFTTLQKINQLNKLSKSSVFVDITNVAGAVNKDSDSGLISIVPKGEIGHSILYSLIKAQSIYQELFPVSTGRTLENIVVSLLNDMGLDKEDLGRERYIRAYETAFNAIKAYMYTMPNLELFGDLKTDRSRLLNGDTSLGKSILELQQNPEFITNGFLKYIEVEPQYKGDAYLISFKAPFGTDMNEKEILSGFYELATSENEIVREIARELALYPYATGDAGNIQRFIPVDYYMRDIDFQTSIADFDNEFNFTLGNQFGVNILKDQIVQNNPEEYSVKFNYSTNNDKDNAFKQSLKPLINNAATLKDVKNFKIKVGDFQVNEKTQSIVKSLKIEKLNDKERKIAAERNVDFKYPAYILINDSYTSDFFPQNDWSVNYLYKRVSEAIPENGIAEYERINILGYKSVKEYDFNNLRLESSIKNNQVDVSAADFAKEESDLRELVQGLEVEAFDLSNPAVYVNHSGGAYGADTFWDVIGREFGVQNHKHYREESNKGLSKKLRDSNVQATVLSKQEMDKARAEVKRLLGEDYPDTTEGNLKVRNYYQVANADAVYAIAELDSSIDKSKPDNLTDPTKSIKSYKFDKVKGGTNVAVQLGIKLNKPVYVWDLNNRAWFKYDGKQFVQTETPKLTRNFAGVGSRDIEAYNVKNKETGQWEQRQQYKGPEIEEAAKQAIRDVYNNTLGKTKEVVKEELKRETTPDKITKENLPENGYFVFGSNDRGVHGLGAAKAAVDDFGAVTGQASGLQGRSFAIRTKMYQDDKLTVYPKLTEENKKAMDKMTIEDLNALRIEALNNPDNKYYVTEIGTKLAGRSVEQMKDLFRRMNDKFGIPDNIILPKAFEVRTNEPYKSRESIVTSEEEIDEQPSTLIGYKNSNFIVEGSIEEGFKVFYTDKDGVKTKEVEDMSLYNKVTLAYQVETYPENVVTLTDMPSQPKYYIDIAGEIYSLQESTYGTQITSDDILKRVNKALAGRLENDTETVESSKEIIKKSLDPETGKRINVPEGSNPNNMVIFEDENTKYLMNDGQQEAYNFIKANVEKILKDSKRVRVEELENTVSFLDPLSIKFSGVIPKVMWDNMIGLAGRGGVGKTTVIRAIMDSLDSGNKYRGVSIMYLTPSHTAATVLQESLGLDSEKANDGTVNTIPSAVRRNKIDQNGNLVMASTEDYALGLKYKPAFSSPDVIIVDESSMVTTQDIKDMLERTAYDLKNGHSFKMPIFIFMGDYRQLGPIGEQQNAFVNKGIISSTLLLNKEKTKELTQVMRSGDKLLHQIYDSVGNEIIDNINRTKEGKQPRQLSFDKYDALTNKSTENMLVVDNEVGVIDDYTDFLSQNNNPYGMFWVHYNRVENPNTINLADKIRKLYFLKIGKQIEQVDHRNFSNGDYVEFTDALEMRGSEFQYKTSDEKLEALLKERKVPFNRDREVFNVSGGIIKPRSRYKIIDIVSNVESIKDVVSSDLRRHLPDFDVTTENILLYNRQNKIRGYRKPLGLSVEMGKYNSKTSRQEDIKIKDAKTGNVLATFSMHYREFKNISAELRGLTSKKMPFTPSYVGSSHTAQGNSIKNVIVGDYNVKQARQNAQINQDDIFSSMYVSLTRTSGTLIVIKPRGSRIIHNQEVFQGAIRDDNKSKTKLDNAIKPASTSVAPVVGETTSVRDIVDPTELNLNSLMNDAMDNAITALFQGKDTETNSKDFLNRLYKQTNSFNKSLLMMIGKTGIVTPFKIVINRSLKNPGEYNSFTKTISINPELILQENNSFDLDGAVKSLHDVIVHELMHHLTADLLMAKPETLSSEQRKWVEDLNDLFKAVQQKLLSDPVHGPALQRAMDQVNREDGMLSAKDKSLYYGLTNIHDFVSMLMTDSGFQEFMNNITYDGKKSVLDRIMDMLADLLKLLNINIKEDSVLKEGVTKIVGLIQSRNKTDQNSIQKSIVTKEIREKNISDNLSDIVKALSIKIKC